MSTYQPREGSSCDKALKAIRAHGQRISEEALSVLLDCDLNEVAALLNYPIKLGILKKVREDDVSWFDEGDGVPLVAAPATAHVAALAAVKHVTRSRTSAQARQAEDDAPLVTAPRETPPIAAKPDIEHFACALYSDGRFVIEFGDQKLVLPEHHTIKLVNYVDRLAAEDA